MLHQEWPHIPYLESSSGSQWILGHSSDSCSAQQESSVSCWGALKGGPQSSWLVMNRSHSISCDGPAHWDPMTKERPSNHKYVKACGDIPLWGRGCLQALFDDWFPRGSHEATLASGTWDKACSDCIAVEAQFGRMWIWKLSMTYIHHQKALVKACLGVGHHHKMACWLVNIP